MYCHQCGAKTYGTYCSHCGAKLITADSDLEPLPQDWADEIRYEVLLRRPEVRDLITRHASQAHKHMSADDFLELCDKAFVPLTGVSLAKIGAIVQPIYATLGIKTGKTRKELFAAPAGKVLVAVFAHCPVMDSRSIKLNKVRMVVCSRLAFPRICGVSRAIF